MTGKELRRWRVNACGTGISLEKFAEESGVSRHSIMRYELRGETDLDELARVGKVKRDLLEMLYESMKNIDKNGVSGMGSDRSVGRGWPIGRERIAILGSDG